MSLPHEPGSPELPRRRPTRELLLAHALDACLVAERKVPGSAQQIIAQQPAWARADLQRMMSLARSLENARPDGRMSPNFREAARARLMQHMGAESGLEPVALRERMLTALPSWTGGRPGSRRRLSWLWRGSAGLLAAALTVAATMTASASALPGEPLYGLKQAQEELSVRLAPDDQERALALLGQADARLDETARLLQQGRTQLAIETTVRYGHVIERATTTYVVTMDNTAEQLPAAQHLETRLNREQNELQSILETAPEQARADLREALVTTSRGRALVADPRPVEQALGRPAPARSALAAAVPTPAAEDLPTISPTRPPAIEPTSTPPPQPRKLVVAETTAQPTRAAIVAQNDAPGRGRESGSNTQNTIRNSDSNDGRRASRPATPVASADEHNGHGGDADAISPALEARGSGVVDRRETTLGRSGPSNDPNDDSEPGLADERSPTQPNTNANLARTRANTNRNANASQSEPSRDRDDDEPQPPARPPLAPATTPAQVAPPAERPSVTIGSTAGGRDNARENADSRSVPPTPTPARSPSGATATPARRGGGGDAAETRPTSVQTRNGPADPHGGGNGNGGNGNGGNGNGGNGNGGNGNGGNGNSGNGNGDSGHGGNGH